MAPKPGALATLSLFIAALQACDLVRGAAARHIPPCPEHCLRCDAAGSCLSCAARYGLTSGTPKRCRSCTSRACIDCNANYKKCSRCGFVNWYYLDRHGECKQCASIYGPCHEHAGCHPDGRCKACNVFPTSQYEDGFDPDYSYAMINGTCQSVPTGCLVTTTLPDGTCSRCMSPGYVLLRNGTCKEDRRKLVTRRC
ncbi:hypothetical protein ABPG75_002753 [Micractinium tetrahymenae]